MRCSYLPFSLDHSEKMKRFTFFNTLLFRHLFFCKNCKNGNCYLICFCLLFILSSAERIKSSQIMKRFLFSKNGGFRAKLATIRFSRSKSKQTSNSIPGLRKLRVNWDKLPFCLLDGGFQAGTTDIYFTVLVQNVTEAISWLNFELPEC